MTSFGQPVSLLEPDSASLPQLLETGQERQLAQLLAAAAVEGANKLQYYVHSHHHTLCAAPLPACRHSKVKSERKVELQRKGRRWLLCAAAAIAAYVVLSGQYIDFDLTNGYGGGRAMSCLLSLCK